MNKKDWTLALLPLLLTVLFDILSKRWALGLQNDVALGWLHLSLHSNSGAMLGLFSELPALLRMVSLATVGAFVLCIFTLIQYLLPIRSLKLRAGLSFLVGGILSNVVDRMTWGYVIDFIFFQFPFWQTPVFNLADLLQWLGYGMILHAIVRDGKKIWPDQNARKQLWINPKFQLKYCWLLMAAGLGMGFVSLVFSYAYFKVTLDSILMAPHASEKFLRPFVYIFLLVTAGFSILMFTAGKLISHRIAGPIYAFEKFLDELLNGKKTKFQLRTDDEFKHLESVAQSLQKRI